jgi:hypothetical protein
MGDISNILGFVFFFGGPCALAYSLVSTFRTRDFIRRSVEVTGEVIRLERSVDRGGSASYIEYAPVFSFTVADGNAYTVISKISSSPADFNVGESVRVRYDPTNPQDARIHTFLQTWGAAVIFGVIGIGFTITGCKLLGIMNLVK